MSAAYEANGRAVARGDFYALACDPSRHVAVEACAGAGKTWMLVSRMVRALLDGAAPHEILAITFTKKAAGEMRQRLHEWLEAFARATPEELVQELQQRGVSPGQAQVQAGAAAQLLARVLRHGRPVQIRTFHSWFAALLRNAPLAVLAELGLPASYELLESEDRAVAQVWRPFHARVLDDAALRQSYDAVVAQHGRHLTLQALDAALRRRVEFALADAQGVADASVPHFSTLHERWRALAHPLDSLAQGAVRQCWHEWASALGRSKGAVAPKAAQAVLQAYAEFDAVWAGELPVGSAARDAALQSAFETLRRGFFVAAEDRLTHHLSKLELAREIETELLSLRRALRQHEAWIYQQHMVVLTRALVQTYAQTKRERGWIDMNDVELAAQRMLGDPTLGAWVQERLDARTRHLLIDEFQDTNPLQWQTLHVWLSSYAGAGGGSSAPSLFIVGDPKQSIYRFRRAEPQVFLAAQAFVQALGGDVLKCDHTRRNAKAVLAEVNRCLLQAQSDGEYSGYRPHTTESAQGGAVLALPQIARVAKDAGAKEASNADGLVWRDSLVQPRHFPEESLRSLEGRQAAQWVATQLNAGCAPKEILVLARKRERLSVLQDELRSLGLAAQQPEKTSLGDAPEVQDVVALLDVLVSPGHDLALARALKSPLFGWRDEDLALLAQACRRPPGSPRVSWWDTLVAGSGLPQALQAAGAQLLRWRGWTDTLPPHDALHAIYADADVVARFVAAAPRALRASVQANLNALLWAALQHEGGRYATPYALVRAVRAGWLPSPAVGDVDAVRLLTVHGAKGLEAERVLLLDTDAQAVRPTQMGVLVDWPGEQPAPLRFVFLARESDPAPSVAALLASEVQARQREELNALYVALTRAKQTLVLSSVQPHRVNPGSWWSRLAAADKPAPAQANAEGLGGANVPIQPDPHLQLPELPPLAPERRMAVQPTPSGDAAMVLAGRALAGDSTESVLGRAMHRLLEWAACGDTSFSATQLQSVSHEFALEPQQAQQAGAMAQRILTGAGAWAWHADVLAWQGNEVNLHWQGAALRLDRLVQRSDTGHWWVLDHKSAAEPERNPALVDQLRQYRMAVQAANPGAIVRAAFLTAAGELKEIA